MPLIHMNSMIVLSGPVNVVLNCKRFVNSYCSSYLGDNTTILVLCLCVEVWRNVSVKKECCK